MDIRIKWIDGDRYNSLRSLCALGMVHNVSMVGCPSKRYLDRPEDFVCVWGGGMRDNTRGVDIAPMVVDVEAGIRALR